MNIGVDRALREGATSLLLLNPDARVDPADVVRLIDQVETHTGLLLAPQIVTPDGSPWMSGTLDLRLADGTVGSSRRRPHGAEVMIWVSGAVMAMSTELWERIGGFDDDYFLYWEDIDLCRRVHEVGGEVRVDESVVAVHDEGGTHADGGGRAKSEAYYYYNIRNRAVFASKWLSKSDQRRWKWTTPRTAKAVLYRGGRRQFVQSIKPWRGYVRGVIASYLVKSRGRVDAPVRVLQSFASPRPTTNPYITMLDRTLAANVGIDHLCFDWRTALLDRYDVIHWHWPETRITGGGWLKLVAKHVLAALLILRIRVSRIAVVRTMHNLDLPEVPWPTTVLLRIIDRETDYRITLNEFTPVPEGQPSCLIKHGHYRDWYADYERRPRQYGQLATFGAIRRYKSLDVLFAAYEGAFHQDPTVTLRFGGQPSSPAIEEWVTSELNRLPGASAKLQFLDDDELVSLVTSSELVVLAYRHMHNSGSVLAALSLDRPVLVPRNEVNEALAAEVGGRWVHLYDEPLDGSRILEALAGARMLTPNDHPNLAEREWEGVGAAHEAAFRAAREVRMAKHWFRSRPA
jgi:GT2 family glycosyltransferase